MLKDSANLITWNVEGRSLTLRYCVELVRDLIALAEEGYQRSAWGGVEIGGVLFGKKDPDGIHLTAYRKLECEHRFGPSFELSASDLERLDALLASPTTDEGLKDLVPVGWYYSASQRDLHLSNASLAVINRSFREPWHMTLHIRRSKQDPAVLGFFFREPSGAMRLRTPYIFSLADFQKLNSGDSSSVQSLP